MPPQVDHSESGATTLMNWVQLLVISYLNAVKTWLIVKEHHLDEAIDQFQGIHNPRSKKHLGTAIDTSQLIYVYVECKVSALVEAKICA